MRKKNTFAKGLIGVVFALALTGCSTDEDTGGSALDSTFEQETSVETSAEQTGQEEGKASEEEEVTIKVGYPKFEEVSSWSDSAYAQMVPKPDTRVLEVDYDKEDVFVCTAYDFDYEDYREYIETCLNSGYTEVEDNKNSFYCKNVDSYQIALRYFDYMRAMEVTIQYDED